MTKKRQLSIQLDIGELTVRKVKRALVELIVMKLSDSADDLKFKKKKITIKTGTTSSQVTIRAELPNGKSLKQSQISGSIGFNDLYKILEDSIDDEVFVFISQHDTKRCTHCENLDYTVTQKEYTLKDIKDMLAKGGKLSSTKTKTGKLRKVAKKWIGKFYETVNVSDNFSQYNCDQHPRCRCVFAPLSIYLSKPNRIFPAYYPSKP